MSAELLPVWNEIEKYIDAGISVIPVRDTNSAQGVAKSPYGNWKACQITPLTKDELFEQMDTRYNTTAVGIIGGKVSGNLEIIDIDVKYKQGIDATLFTDLKTLYPDLLKKVRIHKTPSGGFHILYRCVEPIEGNQKLAGRDKTPEELALEPRPKTVNFLETRGEGGYVCFTEGHKVIRKPKPGRGFTFNRLVDIKEIKPGDVLQAYDEVSGSVVETTVQENGKRYVKETYIIKFGDRNGFIRLTGEHPLYTTKGWKQAKDIKIGDELFHLASTNLNLPLQKHTFKKGGSYPYSNDYKKNPYKQKVMSHRPNGMTGYEKFLKSLAEDSKIPIKFIGDGSFIINSGEYNLSPDFIIEGTNKLIEVSIDWHKKNLLGAPKTALRGMSVNDRLELYKNAGYEVIYIDATEWKTGYDENTLEIINSLRKKLIEYYGNGIPVTFIQKVMEDTTVYNLHCEPYNNYFVRRINKGSQFLLAHNCAPPALGYSIAKNVPIPVLTMAERNSLISLCRSYNEIITPEKAPYKPTKSEDAYYDTNPFEDFNNRVDPSALVTEFGWKEFKHNNHFVWYTRPGKSKGVSMSFNLQKRFFYCFTASTEFEENKGYSPANLLALLAHGGDKKRLYADLVQRGYGKIKPKVEQRLAKTAAINGKPLPTNASQEALAVRAQLSATIDELHPFGTFWIDSTEHGIQIDRELLYRVASGLGFMLWHNHLVRSDGKFIEEVEDRFFFDTLKAYVHEEDADLYKDICNAFESFIEKHGKFTITRLPILPDTAILADTKDEAFKCYQNGILRITSDSIDLYPSSPLLIWKHALQPRSFFHSTGGRYVEFLKLATGEISDYLLSCIGYLAHEYKDETTGYIIVLTEQCENPKDGGGAGKNVFSNLFRHITSFTGKPGEQIKYDEKFMQSWNYQKIFCISDAPKNFNFSFLKELSTGTGLMKKLFKDEQEIPTELMPKFLVQTNYSIEIKDGGLKRRVKIIEFTDFFTKVGGIDVHFDCHFPNEWNQEDWNGYDTLMATAVQRWLKGGRKIGASTLSTGGWMKQFEHSYGAVAAGFIKEHIDHWLQSGYVTNESFKEQFERFCVENNTPIHYRPSMNKVNDALVEWCKQHELQFMNQLVYRDLLGTKKRKWFGRKEDVPF